MIEFKENNRKIWLTVDKSMNTFIINIGLIALVGSGIYSILAIPFDFRYGIYPKIEDMKIKSEENTDSLHKLYRDIDKRILRLEQITNKTWY